MYFQNNINTFYIKYYIKNCIILFGMMVGMVAGALIYRYSIDVQNLADKGEKMVKQEVQKIKKAGSASAKKAN